MSCEDVRAALSIFDTCVETEEGSRVATHCLYPSFESVYVFVVKVGDGFKVHDAGGASRVAWIHGRDYPLIKRVIARQATRYCVSVSESGDTLFAEAKNSEWLSSAILAVANASASAAHLAIERMVSATEALLGDRIYEALARIIPSSLIAREYGIPGDSGKQHKFDFAIKTDKLVLLDAVAPHHISISAKYVAFADVHKRDATISNIAVHDRPLDSGDESLLLQVAKVVPIKALDANLQQARLH